MRAEGQGSSAAHSGGPGVRAWWASGGSGGLGATQKAPGSGLTSDGSPVAFGFRLWRGVGTLVAEDCPGWTVQNSRRARSRPRGSRDPGLCSFLRLDRRVWAGGGSSRDVRATVFVHVGVPRPLPPSLSPLASRPLRVHGRRCSLCRPAASGGTSCRWFHCRSWNGKGRAAWPARTARGTVTASAFCLGGHAGVACSSGPSPLPRWRLRGGRGRTGEWHTRLPAAAGAEILPMARGPGEAARPPAASCLRAPGLVRGVRGVRATDSQRGGRGRLR